MAYLTKNLPSYLFVACSHLDLADGGAWFSQQMKRCQDCWASCNAVEWTLLSSPAGRKTCKTLLMPAKDPLSETCNLQSIKETVQKNTKKHSPPPKKKMKPKQQHLTFPSLVPQSCTESRSQGSCQLWSLNTTAARNTINNSQKNAIMLQ